MLVPRVLPQVLLKVSAPRAFRVPRVQYLPAQWIRMLSKSQSRFGNIFLNDAEAGGGMQRRRPDRTDTSSRVQ